MRSRIKCLTIVLLFLTQTAIAAGWIPYIRNYPRSEYLSGAQNWAISEDPGGWIYVANQNGLLSFDGNSWQVCSPTSIRSVLFSSEGKILFGGYNCFGYLQLQDDGKYHRFDYKPDIGNFSDIWNIVEIEGYVYYISYKFIFKTKEEDYSIIESYDRISCSLSHNGTLYLFLSGKGLAVLAGNQIVTLVTSKVLSSENIVSIVPYGNGQLILVSESGRVFIYSDGDVSLYLSNAEDSLKKSQPYSAAIYQNTLFIGTIHSGLFVLDLPSGDYKWIGTEQGLQNNSVHRIHVTPLGNVWLSLDNGISYVNFRAPLTSLYSSAKYGRGYAALIKDNEFYFGTNIGVFKTDWPVQDAGSLPAYQIDGLNSQIWTLNNIDGSVFCGSNAGAYVICDGEAFPVDEGNGYFSLCEAPGHDDLIVGGTYTGLAILNKTGKVWSFGWNLDGFDKSCMKVLYDNELDEWWIVSDVNVCRLKLSSDYRSIVSISKMDSSKMPYKRNGKVVLDSLGRTMIISDELGNEWYLSNMKLYRDYYVEGTRFTDSLVTSLVANNTVQTFQNVYPVDSCTAIITTVDGLSIYDFSEDISPTTDSYLFNLREFSVSSSKDDFHVYFDAQNQDKIVRQAIRYCPEGVYRFRINTSDDRLLYSMQLSHVNAVPVPITNNGIKEYTGLREGKYTLQVWARDPISGEYGTDSMSFVVSPPWFRSILMKILYLILIVGSCAMMLVSIYKYSKRKTKAEFIQKLVEDAKNEERLKNQMLEHEKTILALQNENLQESIRLKSNEISNSMLNIIQNQELLSSIQNDTQQIAALLSESKIDAARNAAHVLSERINESLQIQGSWKVLEDNFNVVHHDFITKIKDAYPQLNNNDIKLAIFIRMNLLTKEIAPLMGISERGLESARFRLRHKLNLPKSERLSDFLNNI